MHYVQSRTVRLFGFVTIRTLGYAMALVLASLNTRGGPVRNERAEVIDTQGMAIPCLYSAGELGSIYAYRYQAGANLGECFAFGRIAGRNAARNLPG